MKNLAYLLFLLPLAAAAQAPKTGKMVTLNCRNFVSCALFDSLTLYEPDGLAARVVTRAGRTADSSFVFNVPAGKAKIYAMGISEFAFAKVILGEEPTVSMWGDCNKINFSRAIGDANTGYRNMNKRVEALRAETDEFRVNMLQGRQDGNAGAEKFATENLGKNHTAKKAFLDSLRTKNNLLFRIAALLLPPNWEAQPKGSTNSEPDFYAREYFQNVDWKDPIYNDISEVADGFKFYVTQLASLAIPQEAQKSFVEQMLAKLPADSKAYKFALAGICTGYQPLNGPLYNQFAQRYINEFKGKDHGEVRRLEQELARTRTFTAGQEAPDLVGDTPDGKQQSLYAMRGNVVLIDFWASWCGPCIRELPTVKAAYEKYHAKGFDILGVSLDSQKENWVKKIDEIGMPWKHISDLKGWQSSHAALYTVTSIPQTVLLDKNGLIIQRNLRGEALGEKLKEIFGE